MCRVSVVIATYNRADVVGEAIDSVLAQTYRDFEIIVVDDASTDNTAGVISRYGDQIRYLRREANGGVGAARNDGIRASTGEFICFLDCDDVYLPRRLQAAVAFLDQNPDFCAVHTDCQVRGPAGEVMAESMIAASGCRKRVVIWRDVALHEPMHTNTITIRRECLREVGLFNEALRRGQDSELWLRLSHRRPVAQLPEVLAVWHRRETTWRQSVIARRAIAVWQAAREWLEGSTPSDLRLANSLLARAYWRLAISLHAEGDPEAPRARQQAVSHCVANHLVVPLLLGLAVWYGFALALWARAAGRGVCQLGKRASGEMTE